MEHATAWVINNVLLSKKFKNRNSLLICCLLGNVETCNYPLQIITNLYLEFSNQFCSEMIWNILRAKSVIILSGWWFQERNGHVLYVPKLSISYHISSLFLTKLTTDYRSFSHRLSKYAEYFVVGGRQESNFKIWYSTLKYTKCPYLCQLNWLSSAFSLQPLQHVIRL